MGKIKHRRASNSEIQTDVNKISSQFQQLSLSNNHASIVELNYDEDEDMTLSRTRKSVSREEKTPSCFKNILRKRKKKPPLTLEKMTRKELEREYDPRTFTHQKGTVTRYQRRVAQMYIDEMELHINKKNVATTNQQVIEANKKALEVFTKHNSAKANLDQLRESCYEHVIKNVVKHNKSWLRSNFDNMLSEAVKLKAKNICTQTTGVSSVNLWKYFSDVMLQNIIKNDLHTANQDTKSWPNYIFRDKFSQISQIEQKMKRIVADLKEKQDSFFSMSQTEFDKYFIVCFNFKNASEIEYNGLHIIRSHFEVLYADITKVEESSIKIEAKFLKMYNTSLGRIIKSNLLSKLQLLSIHNDVSSVLKNQFLEMINIIRKTCTSVELTLEENNNFYHKQLLRFQNRLVSTFNNSFLIHISDNDLNIEKKIDFVVQCVRKSISKFDKFLFSYDNNNQSNNISALEIEEIANRLKSNLDTTETQILIDDYIIFFQSKANQIKKRHLNSCRPLSGSNFDPKPEIIKTHIVPVPSKPSDLERQLAKTNCKPRTLDAGVYFTLSGVKIQGTAGIESLDKEFQPFLLFAGFDRIIIGSDAENAYKIEDVSKSSYFKISDFLGLTNLIKKHKLVSHDGTIEHLSSSELLALYFRKLRSEIEVAFNIIWNQVVIVVPLGFSILQRKVIKQAANMAGFNFSALISNTAAAMQEFSCKTDDNIKGYYVAFLEDGFVDAAYYEYQFHSDNSKETLSLVSTAVRISGNDNLDSHKSSKLLKWAEGIRWGETGVAMPIATGSHNLYPVKYFINSPLELTKKRLLIWTIHSMANKRIHPGLLVRDGIPYDITAKADFSTLKIFDSNSLFPIEKVFTFGGMEIFEKFYVHTTPKNDTNLLGHLRGLPNDTKIVLKVNLDGFFSFNVENKALDLKKMILSSPDLTEEKMKEFKSKLNKEIGKESDEMRVILDKTLALVGLATNKCSKYKGMSKICLLKAIDATKLETENNFRSKDSLLLNYKILKELLEKLENS